MIDRIQVNESNIQIKTNEHCVAALNFNTIEFNSIIINIIKIFEGLATNPDAEGDLAFCTDSICTACTMNDDGSYCESNVHIMT